MRRSKYLYLACFLMALVVFASSCSENRKEKTSTKSLSLSIRNMSDVSFSSAAVHIHNQSFRVGFLGPKKVASLSFMSVELPNTVEKIESASIHITEADTRKKSEIRLSDLNFDSWDDMLKFEVSRGESGEFQGEIVE